MKRLGLLVALAFVVALLLPAAASAANIIANGDFEAGNTGFTSGYGYFSIRQQDGGAWIWWPGGYAVGVSPYDWHGYWPVFGDHTSGSGKMQVVNGATNANLPLWSETVPVEPSSAYRFSFWVAATSNLAPANLEVRINGVSIGSSLSGTDPGMWQQATFDWDSGSATTAQIVIYDKTVAHSGNDFCIDDVSMDVQGIPVSVDIGGEYGDKMMDTYLYEAQADAFLGASTANFVGRTGAGEERAVLSIPLAKLSGVDVTAATLDLTKSNGTLIPLKAYRLLPTLGKPTWNVSAAGAPWGAAGANAAGVDYSDEASATSSTGDFDVTALLQAAIADGEQTLDLVLLDPAPVARRYVGFYAADAVHPAYRPCLRVEGTQAP